MHGLGCHGPAGGSSWSQLCFCAVTTCQRGLFRAYTFFVPCLQPELPCPNGKDLAGKDGPQASTSDVEDKRQQPAATRANGARMTSPKPCALSLGLLRLNWAEDEECGRWHVRLRGLRRPRGTRESNGIRCYWLRCSIVFSLTDTHACSEPHRAHARTRHDKPASKARQ